MSSVPARFSRTIKTERLMASLVVVPFRTNCFIFTVLRHRCSLSLRCLFLSIRQMEWNRIERTPMDVIPCRFRPCKTIEAKIRFESTLHHDKPHWHRSLYGTGGENDTENGDMQSISPLSPPPKHTSLLGFVKTIFSP